jgi:hypothetical protein
LLAADFLCQHLVFVVGWLWAFLQVQQAKQAFFDLPLSPVSPVFYSKNKYSKAQGVL